MINNSYQDIIEKSPVGYSLLKFICNKEGIPVDYELMEANEAFEIFTGLKRSSFIGKRFTEILPEDSDELRWIIKCRNVDNTGKSIDFVHFMMGQNRWYRINAHCPETGYCVIFFTDISKEMVEKEWKDIVLTSNNDIIFVLNQDYIFENVITSDDTLLYSERQSILGNSIYDIFTEESVKKVFLDAFGEILNTREKKRITYKLMLQGEEKWFDADILLKENSLSENKFIVSIRETTKQKLTESELEDKKEELERFFRINLDLLCIADLDGNFVKVNTSWEKILGYSIADLEKRRFLDFVHPEDLNATLEAISKLAKDEQVLYFVNRYKCRDGSYRYLEWCSRPYGNLIYAAARDITERYKMAEELQESEKNLRKLTLELENQNLQLHEKTINDKLTGIRNRYYFETRINEEISMALQYKKELCLLMFDLDKFKNVNDTYGHDTGDQVLIRIANTVQKLIRKSDVFARWGGEEFVILLPGMNSSHACVVADKIRTVVEKVNHIPVGPVTINIGLAEYRYGESVNDWFKRVDLEMYHAKSLGRNRISCTDRKY
jgi:diguanylate cyclase (GGDEF)-like protein/PAS domain S-box-containing protein